MALDEYLASEIVLDCTDGIVTRREALRRLMLLGVTAPAAAALLAACGNDDDDSARSPASAARATQSSAAGAGSPAGQEIRFTGPQGDLIGVIAAAPDPKGAILVIHENRGLTPHIRSIPPRLAADGYTALAVDLLSEEGGTASMPSEGDATAALGRAPSDRMIADLRAALDELQRRAPGVKLAVVGFCFGGGMTWQLLAAGEPRLSAAVPFYGPTPANADFSGSPNAAVLAIYAEKDSRVNASQDAARQALEAAGLVHDIRVFPGVDHAFFNDTGARYNAEQAAAAYSAMLDWFGRHLGAAS
ncbi:MAG TPA: dienelactone hydrolase family protein [Ilumatobacteraceae bacterium]|nr:dienelactone hydrolase family protein [Ilumatobacteraceae bacterium]